MNIAILRTEQADRDRAYNKLEYAAALNGARVVGYVHTGHSGSFRGFPLLTPAEIGPRGVQLVVSPSPLTPESRRPLDDAGWGERVVSFETQRDQCLALWRSDALWLTSRQAAVVNGELVLDAQHARIGGPAVEDMPSQVTPAEQRDITERVLRSYRAAMNDAPAAGPYAIGRNWRAFLQATRPAFYQAAAGEDVAALETLLDSCFRNEMSSGILGGREAYDAFASAGTSVFEGMRRQFDVWKYSVTDVNVGRLAAPFVGNPYGVWINDGVVHPNTFLDDYRAGFILGLTSGVPRPVVVDIGGGFGGFCHQLIAHGGDAVYVGFDLPDNLIVASHFLLSAHPEKRVLLYQSASQPLDADLLREYDIVLMPNFMLPRLDDRSVDVCTNFTSLSEMDYATIVEYLGQIDRVGRGYFYQENLLDNGDNYEFYPVPVFPGMAHFRQIARAPSRWPFFSATSPYHCHGECLSVHREIDHARYFGVVPAIRRAA
jgi:hypothetical protein